MGVMARNKYGGAYEQQEGERFLETNGAKCYLFKLVKIMGPF
jgi:hypothetical protein